MTRPSVVLTQPALRAGGLVASLRARGFELACWPMTAIGEVAGLDWSALSVTLAGCRWVLLPSPGAIEVVMGALEQRGFAWPRAVGVGVVGPGSREALERWRARLAGLDAVPVLEPRCAPHDADALLADPELASLSGVDVAVLRRADGREAWLQTLRARGARLHAVSVYTAHDAMPPTDASNWIAARAACDAPLVFSVAGADAGDRLGRFVDGLACAGWARGRPVLTQHPRIAEALLRQGWRCVERHPPGADGLAAAIESACPDPS
jgi:uroporphyrinogen III methyltransferase/synthase